MNTLHLIKLAVKRGDIEMAVKHSVMVNLQPNGRGVFVYEALMTAEEAGMTPAQFAGGLGALTKKGVYSPSEDPEFKGLFGYFNNI